jgi:nicotinamide mononucleotide adenylyltransferase/SAM-dependent methyltransferase
VIGLLVGRFHALTRAQAAAFLAFAAEVEQVVCVVTSADHAETRRNPLPYASRRKMLEELFDGRAAPAFVPVPDLDEDTAWVAAVRAGLIRVLSGVPARMLALTANRDVAALLGEAGVEVRTPPPLEVTPAELIAKLVAGQPWREQAAAPTLALYDAEGWVDKLRAIHADRLRTDDGELAAHRDFESYGAQMDASLQQKLDDLLPWVKPGRIVDKGCGTGRLMVELSRRFPDSAFVGVDLSRELLRRSDENTYYAGDVELLLGDAAAPAVAPGSATTVIFSSIMHEIYTYAGYDQARIEVALAAAAADLGPGGRVLIRDGVSPGHRPVRLQLLDEPTREIFERFARELKHGAGAPHERLAPDLVRLDHHLANEFLCKKDYLKNWHIEVHEEFGPRTVEAWGEALERHGFSPLALGAYVNPWIAEHRYAGKVALFDDDGQPLGWPATNVVAVGERR